MEEMLYRNIKWRQWKNVWLKKDHLNYSDALLRQRQRKWKELEKRG